MTHVAVIMPVGQGDAEVERCRDTAAALLDLEPAVRSLVLVDDSPAPRRLDLSPRPDVTVVKLRPPAAGRVGLYDRIAANVLAGFEWVARNAEGHIALKLDTDAMVIAPFAEKLAARFAREPDVGLVGSFDRMSGGARRSFEPWRRPVERASRRLQWRHSGRRPQLPRLALTGRPARARAYVLEARRAGYEWGEHALAAALAVRPEVLAEWRRDDVLEDPRLFTGTGLGDDPVLGILVRRTGRRQAGMVDPGDPFALAWRGLPDSPERLFEQGYSIIHSVKNDQRWSESEIRERCRRLRHAA